MALGGRRLARYAGLLLSAILLLNACASGSDGDRSEDTVDVTRYPSSDPTTALGKRCGQPDAEAEMLTLKGDDSTLSAAVLGDSPDVVVLLHQAGTIGLCNAWEFGNWLVDQDVRAVLLDFCGYGDSSCSDSYGSRWTDQVSLAVDWANANGAKRVTVVGGSMGGSIALQSAMSVGADAVVDLSGDPDPNFDTPVEDYAPRITIPTLIVMALSDRSTVYAALKKTFALITAETKKFISAPSGHGYDILAGSAGAGLREWRPPALLIADWAKGDYRLTD